MPLFPFCRCKCCTTLRPAQQQCCVFTILGFILYGSVCVCVLFVRTFGGDVVVVGDCFVCKLTACRRISDNVNQVTVYTLHESKCI